MKTYRRDGKKQYRSALRDLIAGQPAPASAALPLTHITDCIRLPDVLRDGALDPRHCAVFGDDRLYAFYARPAYRSNKDGPLHNINYAPACFIFDASVSQDCFPVEVFPFDTGALHAGHLSAHVHQDLSPFDFALERNVSSAQRLASLFFGSERNYFEVKPKNQTFAFSKADAEIASYDSLVTRSTGGPHDERGTSIEFHFKDRLPVSGKVLAVILPQDYADESCVIDALKKDSIEPLFYSFMPDYTARELVVTFYTLAAAFYAREQKERGWQW